MKELKAFLIVVLVTGAIYWGVEPYAHSILHPHVEPANFDFAKEDTTLAKTNVEKAEAALKAAQTSGDKSVIDGATKTLENAKAELEKYSAFWADIESIDLTKGDAASGANLVAAAGCTACHSIKSAGFEPAMDDKSASEAYGVAPPDL
ncbi:MAG: cytochrome C, partial [Campylobacter sp.]|nr:cytochrome C [Campylobacter sp.]